MDNLTIVQVPVLSDNYSYIIRENETGQTAVVDPAAAAAIQRALDEHDWKLDFVLSTHHHHDHVGGNVALKKSTGCQVVGPSGEAGSIPGIDVALSDGDLFTLGNSTAKIIETPGHTMGHISYWFESSAALFCGDALFSLGCGRLFEGRPAQMWGYLEKLRALPVQTCIYCGHEYTQTNGRFALTVDPDNHALKKRCEEVASLLSEGRPTVPSTLEQELAANPFLRPDSESIRQRLGMQNAADVDVFAELRKRKDRF